MHYRPTWDLRSIPGDQLYAEVSRRVDEMTAATIPDALASIVGAIQVKRRRKNAGGRPIEPVADLELAERRRKVRERMRKWRQG